jgi:hypothetical protein
LYLTSQRLVWWYNFDGRVVFEVPVDKVLGVEVKRKDVGSMLKNKPVLDLVYRSGAGNEVASFSDAVEELNEWRRIISEVIAQKRSAISNSAIADGLWLNAYSGRKEVDVYNERR